MDAVQKANSGHPGTPMGLAPVGYTLWSRFLCYHPEQPDWPNRDRFVLSVGHASMLLYSLLDRSKYAAANGTAQGAYVLIKNQSAEPRVILIATGSEIGLALEAYDQLEADGVPAQVVSMPSWELFEEQDQRYRDSVLPPAINARVVIEQAGPVGWDRYVGQSGAKVVMNSFGASAPLAKLQAKFGFTVENVVKLAHEQIRLVQKR
jgi:transketolase